MSSNFNNNVLDIALKEFELRHPKESWPKWFSKYMIVRGYESNNKRIIRLILRHKIQLESNQYWKEIRGRRVLVNIDETTGKERIVICGGPEVDFEVIFEVEVDITNNDLTVITDTDLDILEEAKYELNNC